MEIRYWYDDWCILCLFDSFNRAVKMKWRRLNISACHRAIDANLSETNYRITLIFILYYFLFVIQFLILIDDIWIYNSNFTMCFQHKIKVE